MCIIYEILGQSSRRLHLSIYRSADMLRVLYARIKLFVFATLCTTIKHVGNAVKSYTIRTTAFRQYSAILGFSPCLVGRREKTSPSE